MNDLISRQAAIDAIKAYLTFADWKPSVQRILEMSVNDTIDMLERLPSAQPERKKGEWIYGEEEHGIDGYHCNKCGFFVPWDYTHTFINYIKDYNFCPNCGADMRGKVNG